MQSNNLPIIATENTQYTRMASVTRCQLVKPAFFPTRHSSCRQLVYSCYAAIGFSGMQTRVYQTRVELAVHSASVHCLIA